MKKTSNLERIDEAIKHLNNVYGVGDVGNVQLFLDGRIVFQQRPYGMKEQTRKGRIDGDTVYALGHQRKLKT